MTSLLMIRRSELDRRERHHGRDHKKRKEDDDFDLPTWLNTKWRPAMAWLYIGVIFCDFIAFPVGHAALASEGLIPYSEWRPLTIQGGGIFHLAMGAILGVAAWGHTRERMAFMEDAQEQYQPQDPIGDTPLDPSPPDKPVKPVRKPSRAD